MTLRLIGPGGAGACIVMKWFGHGHLQVPISESVGWRTKLLQKSVGWLWALLPLPHPAFPYVSPSEVFLIIRETVSLQ
jgi:hypothetical protein